MTFKDVRYFPMESMPFWSNETDLVYLGCISVISRQSLRKSKNKLPKDFYEKRVYPDYTLIHDATVPIQRIEALMPVEDKVVVLWRIPYRRRMKGESNCVSEANAPQG
jgi:hypothetical protein